uniref:SHSP domain-containing protein n=1 Tax=Acrobeloides nanus TaxID=290746 RepID=A0A914CSQ5_9BILA
MRPWHSTFDHRADPFVLPTWDAEAPRDVRLDSMNYVYIPEDRPIPPNGHVDSSSSESSTDGEFCEIECPDRPHTRPAGLRRRGQFRKMKSSKKHGGRDIQKIRKAIRRRMALEKDLEVMLDVSGFRREHLKIKFDTNKLIVEGKHAEHQVEFVAMERHFTWKIPLPEGIGKSDIKCRYLDGLLHIVGTKPPAPSTSVPADEVGEDIIQIDE